MKRNGIEQDITVLPVNSQPIMVMQIGSEENIELIRIGLDTEIEWYNLKTKTWIAGKVLSLSSVKNSKSENIENLSANTQIRLKETPSTSGILILSTKKYDIEYNAEDLQTAYQFLYGSGIIKDKLYGNIIASGGRQITVQSSMFVIDGFIGFFKNPQSIIIDASDNSPRKDLLVLRKVQEEGDVYLVVKKGTPSDNPTPPELTQKTNNIYEIALAEITIQANSPTVNQSDIKDVRTKITTLSGGSGSAIKKTKLENIELINTNGEQIQITNNQGMIYEKEVDLLELLSTKLSVDKSKINIIDWNIFYTLIVNKDVIDQMNARFFELNNLLITDDLSKENGYGYMFSVKLNSNFITILFQLCDETYSNVETIEYENNESLLTNLYKQYGCALMQIENHYQRYGIDNSINAFEYLYKYNTNQGTDIIDYNTSQECLIDSKTFSGNKLILRIRNLIGIAETLYIYGNLRVDVNVRYQILGD